MHLTFNQTLYVGTGELPTNMVVYRGGEVTLQGSLDVISVNVTVEGVIRNVENISIVSGGVCL